VSEFAIRDELTEMGRRLQSLEQATSYLPIRPADAPPRGFERSTASALIDANGRGPVLMVGNSKNGTGFPIWLDSTVVVWTDPAELLIIVSNASTYISGEYVSGTKTEIENYTDLRGANAGHFDDSGIANTNFEIDDPDTLLTSVTGGDRVWFLTGAGDTLPNKLTVVDQSDVPGGGGEGGGFPGWPGPDPGAGTTTLILLKALVNEATDVASSDTSFAFDGATVAGGLGPTSGAPTSGTCNNCGHAFTNNEVILVAGDGTTWQAIKLATNWLKAKVNVSGGVTAATGSFTFDNITALVGTATALASPVAINAPGVDWNDNEDFTAYQRADGDWQPIKGNWNYYVRVRGQAVGAMTANDATWTIDNVELLQGDMPLLSSGVLGFTNIAKIPAANNAVIELRWNQDDARWETEPLVTHMVLGKATAAVSGGSFSIDNIELVSGSDPRSSPSSTSETLSVTNPFGWNIDDNGDVLAVKKADGTWIATQADCPA
jgi:hypothetical protein